MSSLSLHTIDATISSVAIKNGSNELAIDASGFITAKIDGSVTVAGEVELGATTLAALENIAAVVSATDLDIRDLAFATDSVDVSGSSVSIAGVVATSQGAYTGWKAQGVTVGNTAAVIVASAYAGRDEVVIQNVSSNDIYIGPDNTVTTSGATRGLKIPKGTSYAVALSDSADIYAIGDAASQACVVSEFKY